jgi:hypothetical protein
LAAAIRETATSPVDLIVAVDDDDHSGYTEADGYVLVRGPAMGLTDWTNALASTYATSHRFLASFGDDHRPRTPGWDVALCAAIERLGGTGFAYGDDLHRGVMLPTAVVASSTVVHRLGWLCLPTTRHMYVDKVWRELGRAAGLIAYCPDVIIEHLHPVVSKAQWDRTYQAAAEFYQEDRNVFEEWERTGKATDVGRLLAVPA